MAQQGKRLDDTRREAILADISDGLSFTAAARKYDVAVMTVSRYAREAGIPPRQNNLKKETRDGLVRYHRRKQTQWLSVALYHVEQQLLRPDLTAHELLKTTMALAKVTDVALQLEETLRPPQPAPESNVIVYTPPAARS